MENRTPSDHFLEVAILFFSSISILFIIYLIGTYVIKKNKDRT